MMILGRRAGATGSDLSEVKCWADRRDEVFAVVIKPSVRRPLSAASAAPPPPSIPDIARRRRRVPAPRRKLALAIGVTNKGAAISFRVKIGETNYGPHERDVGRRGRRERRVRGPAGLRRAAAAAAAKVCTSSTPSPQRRGRQGVRAAGRDGESHACFGGKMKTCS